MEYPSSDSGEALLGYGTIQDQSDDLSSLENAASWAPAGVWLRLHLTKTQPWRAASIIQAAGLKRVGDYTMAMDWQSDGSGLGDRRTVIQAIIGSQARTAEPITWDLVQLDTMPSAGTSPAATEPPFGWTLPKPELPEVKLPQLPEVKFDIPWVPLGIGVGLLILLRR